MLDHHTATMWLVDYIFIQPQSLLFIVAELIVTFHLNNISAVHLHPQSHAATTSRA